MVADPLREIQSRFDELRYRQHALDTLLQKGIDPAIIRQTILQDDPEVIESYPDHWIGPAYLVLGWWGERRPLHTLFGIGAILWLITGYDPSVDPMRRFLPPDYRDRRPREEEEHG